LAISVIGDRGKSPGVIFEGVHCYNRGVTRNVHTVTRTQSLSLTITARQPKIEPLHLGSSMEFSTPAFLLTHYLASFGGTASCGVFQKTQV